MFLVCMENSEGVTTLSHLGLGSCLGHTTPDWFRFLLLYYSQSFMVMDFFFFCYFFLHFLWVMYMF